VAAVRGRSWSTRMPSCDDDRDQDLGPMPIG
jgi:hypothetical protein